MSEMEKTVETGTDEFEALLPEGWAEGDDIFDEGSWSGSASAEDPAREDSSEETNTDPTDPAPTTEPEADESGAADDASASSAKKFRVPVKINHESSEVEISEADLPALYQKAMAFDRGKDEHLLSERRAHRTKYGIQERRRNVGICKHHLPTGRDRPTGRRRCADRYGYRFR